MLSLFFFLLISFFYGDAVADIGVYNNYDLYQHGEQWGPAPAQRYSSDADVWGPLFNVPIWDRRALSLEETPHLFMTITYVDNAGPAVFNSTDLSLVYTNRTYHFVNNVRVQQYKGEKVLTMWTGRQGHHHAEGWCVALNRHYEVVWNITRVPIFNAGVDLHECEITKDDTVLVTTYEPTHNFDLTSIGGKWNDTLLDSCFAEIDPLNGTVLFSWRASDHIPVTATYQKYANEGKDGFDPWHINSLQKTQEGNYLVDLRRAHSVSLIDGRGGWPIWTLGGKANDFEDLSGGAATSFAWQHHTTFLDHDLTQLTMFDNHGLEWKSPFEGFDRNASRGLRLQLTHYPRRTVKLVHELIAPVRLGTRAMGSYNTLPNSNALIGWGTQAGFTEYTPDGRCVMDVQYGRYGSWVHTYRVYKDKWVGLPKWNPRMSVNMPGEAIHVSWNGATEVRSWAVMFANELSVLHSLVGGTQTFTLRADKKGFETTIEVGDAIQRYALVRVAGLDEYGNVLGATNITHVVDGRSWNADEPITGRFFNSKYATIVSQDSKRPRNLHDSSHYGHHHHHH